MKIHHPLTNIFSNKKALPLMIVAVVSLFTTGPVFAQSTPGIPPIATNADSKESDTNPSTAYLVRTQYFKRFPFAKDAKEHDDLELIKLGPPPKGQPILPGDPGGGGSNTGGEKGGSGKKKNTSNATQDQQNAVNTPGQETNVKKSKLLEQPKVIPVYIPLEAPPYYVQMECIAHDKPKADRDLELFDNQLTTFQVPVSDTQFQIIDRENRQRMLELAFDPERITWMLTTLEQMCHQSGGNALAGSSEAAFHQALQRITKADTPGNGAAGGGGGGAQVGALINIANEQAGVPTAADNPHKEVAQAVWMVQQMYRWVFVPMAILFLLPGAVMTQVKSQIVQGFRLNAEDQSSPFEGILRSVIAVFLIPATQLIVSYSIDCGNSMAYSVKDWVDLDVIIKWSRQLTYNTHLHGPGKPDNAINHKGTKGAAPAAGGLLASIADLFENQMTDGLGGDKLEETSIAERQDWLSSTMETTFNMATYLFSTMVIIFGAYQLVFMCYLYLLGPLAAAFFAWPKTQANSSQNLFRDVFGNWVNAVITVSLWRFYWMVILAIMTQRILYIQDNNMPSDLQWEVAVFTCLLGLMLYVPFNPWSFDPAAAFTAASSGGSSMMQGASGAMGGAAQAGGMPASQVAGVQNQVNSAIAPIAHMGSMYGGLDANSSGSAMSSGTGRQSPQAFALDNHGGQSPGASPSTQSPTPVVAPPPSSSTPPGATTPPAGTPPASTPPASTPPSSQASSGHDNSHAGTQAVANAVPGASVTPMQSSTVPLAPSNGGTNVAVNPNVNPSAAASQAPSMVAAVNGGGNNSAPPSSDHSGGGQQVASSAAPASSAPSGAPDTGAQVASNSPPPGGNQSPGNQGPPPSQNA